MVSGIILAGGSSTRYGTGENKTLVELLGRPVLEYILDLLQEHDVLDAAVTMRYIPSAITAHFGDGYRHRILQSPYNYKQVLTW